jgi:hypothetical protein
MVAQLVISCRVPEALTAPCTAWPAHIVLHSAVCFTTHFTFTFTFSCTRCNRGADKFLARPTSRCILFDGENISFDASLFVYINSTNIPPIMIINRIYETQNLLSL